MIGSAHGEAEESYRGRHRAAQKEDRRTEGQDRQSAGRRGPAGVAQASEAGAAQEASPGEALGACARQEERRPTGGRCKLMKITPTPPPPSRGRAREGGERVRGG